MSTFPSHGFFEQFFAQNYSNVVVELISACFLEFEFEAKLTILKRLSPLHCMMGDFQNGLISRIFGVFSTGFFAQN